jgi:GNAT superfamily N-acetyltransferase
MDLKLIEANGTDFAKLVEDKIEEFNLARWEVKKKIPLGFKVESPSGEFLAGGAGKTFGAWLLIDNIWVHEKLRGQSMGTKILEKLETEAKSRDCKYALLDTLNFQARPFYEKLGYKVEWIQKEYPRDGSKFFMTKVL